MQGYRNNMIFYMKTMSNTCFKDAGTLRECKPYVTDGVMTVYVHDLIPIPEYEDFVEPTIPAPASPTGSVRSAASMIPEHIIAYDPISDRPLLIKVASPEQLVELPSCPDKDYFIQRHAVNQKEFVTSASLGVMRYVARLQHTQKLLNFRSEQSRRKDKFF